MFDYVTKFQHRSLNHDWLQVSGTMESNVGMALHFRENPVIQTQNIKKMFIQIPALAGERDMRSFYMICLNIVQFGVPACFREFCFTRNLI